VTASAGDKDKGEKVSAKPLRVLMVSARYLPDMGGIETHMAEVARRLNQMADLDISVLTTDRSRTRPRSEEVDGVPVLRVPAWPRSRDYYLAPGIAAVVGHQDRWDLIHCQGIHTLVPVLAMVAARRAGLPYMVTFHTGGHSLGHRNALRSAQWRLLGPLLKGAAALVAVSRFEGDTLSEQAHLGDKPVAVIRNGGTLPSAAPGTVSIKGRIISPGRLEQYKGHHRVIEALPYVIKQLPDAHLLVLGHGPYEPELRALADRLGVGDRMVIKQVPPGDRVAMATTLAEANVIAAMSDYEAHPVAVMEALSVGRPVVGYDIAGIGELVAEGLVHGVAPGASPAMVAERLVTVMAAPLPTAIPELPTWDTATAQLAQLYRAVAGRRAILSSGDVFTDVNL
jgi:glycosyltransferase involved in cell wall biosynthesis